MSALFKTILLILEEFLRLFFPLSEDEQIIKGLSPNNFLSKLFVRKSHGCVVLTNFRDKEVRATLHLVKFHRHPLAVELASSLLEAWLFSHVESPATLIPIPLSARRLRERGFNQVEVVVKNVIRSQSGFEMDTHILKRIRHTDAQTKLTKKDRLTNVTGAFTVTKTVNELHSKHIILIDDVMTTGATLKAAREAIEVLKPASVTCVAIAH